MEQTEPRISFFEYKRFLKHLAKLDVVGFFGVAKILNVTKEFKDREKEDFDALAIVIEKYFTLSKKKRKEILKVIKDYNKENKKKGKKEVKADDTKD